MTTYAHERMNCSVYQWRLAHAGELLAASARGSTSHQSIPEGTNLGHLRLNEKRSGPGGSWSERQLSKPEIFQSHINSPPLRSTASLGELTRASASAVVGTMAFCSSTGSQAAMSNSTTLGVGDWLSSSQTSGILRCNTHGMRRSDGRGQR